MKFEVEQKFAITNRTDFEARLLSLGASFVEELTEVDVYFAHPSRDFSQTDEAFRIRSSRALSGEQRQWLTYKGPKIDHTTKTRRELDIPVAGDDEANRAFVLLFESLGFRRAGVVEKSRRGFDVPWRNSVVHATIDQVNGLGDYAELELISDESGVASAKEVIHSLAEQLDLGRPEQRSYLELATRSILD